MAGLTFDSMDWLFFGTQEDEDESETHGKRAYNAVSRRSEAL